MRYSLKVDPTIINDMQVGCQKTNKFVCTFHKRECLRVKTRLEDICTLMTQNSADKIY